MLYMRKLVIGFSDSPSKWDFFAWAIKQYLKAPFFHTYFFFPDEGKKGKTWEATVKGVVTKTRRLWLETHTVIYEYEVEVTEERYQEILNFCKARRGTPYGYLQYIAILLNLKRDNGIKRTICSEYVARGAEQELQIEGNLDKIDPKEVWEVVSKKYPEYKGDKVS